MADYIPAPDAEFNAWQTNFVAIGLVMDGRRRLNRAYGTLNCMVGR